MATKYQRVVALHSFDDGGYEARLKQIASNPDLDGVQFHHVCVIDRARGSPRQQALDDLTNERSLVDPEVKEKTNELIREETGPILESRIREIDAEALIVHGGTMFTYATGAILTVLIDLQQKFPALVLGLEGKANWLVDRSGRQYSGFERRTVTNQIRWVRANFVEEPALEALMEAVF